MEEDRGRAARENRWTVGQGSVNGALRSSSRRLHQASRQLALAGSAWLGKGQRPFPPRRSAGRGRDPCRRLRGSRQRRSSRA